MNNYRTVTIRVDPPDDRLPQLRTQGQGVIINIASSVGYHGVKQQPHYVAVKWGVRGLTAALAMDWSADNIIVLAIASLF